MKELKRHSISSNTINNTENATSPKSVVAALAAIKLKEKSKNVFGDNKPVSKTHDVERGDAPEVNHPKPVRSGVLYQAPSSKKNLTIDVIEYKQPNEISDTSGPKSNFDSDT